MPPHEFARSNHQLRPPHAIHQLRNPDNQPPPPLRRLQPRHRIQMIRLRRLRLRVWLSRSISSRTCAAPAPGGSSCCTSRPYAIIANLSPDPWITCASIVAAVAAWSSCVTVSTCAASRSALVSFESLHATPPQLKRRPRQPPRIQHHPNLLRPLHRKLPRHQPPSPRRRRPRNLPQLIPRLIIPQTLKLPPHPAQLQLAFLQLNLPRPQQIKLRTLPAILMRRKHPHPLLPRPILSIGSLRPPAPPPPTAPPTAAHRDTADTPSPTQSPHAPADRSSPHSPHPPAETPPPAAPPASPPAPHADHPPSARQQHHPHHAHRKLHPRSRPQLRRIQKRPRHHKRFRAGKPHRIHHHQQRHQPIPPQHEINLPRMKERRHRHHQSHRKQPQRQRRQPKPHHPPSLPQRLSPSTSGLWNQCLHKYQ